MVQLNKYAG